MSAGTRAPTIERRALTASLLVHALVLAFMAAAPPHARPAWTPNASSLVDVTLVDTPREPGGSAMPALPDALPSQALVEGTRTETAEAPALMRRRVLAPRRREQVRDSPTTAPVIDLASAQAPTADASEPTVAPSSVGESTSAAAEVGSGELAGTGDGELHAGGGSGASSASDDVPAGLGCPDPWAGVWMATSYQGAPVNTRTTWILRILRSGAQLDLDLRIESWVGYESDLTMPACGSRRQLALPLPEVPFRRRETQFVSTWRASTLVSETNSVRASGMDTYQYICGVRDPGTIRHNSLTLELRPRWPDQLDVILRAASTARRYARVACGDR